MRSAASLALAGLFLSTTVGTKLLAAELADPGTIMKGVRPASDEGARAMKSFSVPEGFKVELIAAEPMLANAVAFSIDEQGKIYVVETFRHGSGILDIRGRRGWPNADFKNGLPKDRLENLASEVLDTDMAVRTVDDRLAYLKNYFGNDAKPLAGETDQIRLLWSSTGSGKPDKATVFADGFTRAEEGLAAGVLAHDGNVWFTNIPDLWWLRDNDGDGMADQRRALRSGFGIRSGFLGHDMHGLVFGPDGKLYFSIGDRAANVAIEGGASLVDYDSGSVFRCNPDGTEMELFATGLRNPQDLTFDGHGNLFTGDNNSDGGDQSRWVQLVEGGDSGWRVGYQHLEGSDSFYSNQARGPWNSEKMWHTQNPDQPEFLVPPVAIIANGPSGNGFYPGTGMSDKWKNHFFLVDFKGQPNISGVHTFKLEPNGAGFKMVDREHFVWNLLATDIDFGVDGGLYVLDWVQGWGVTGKGRIYRIYQPEMEGNSKIVETKELLHDGMRNRKNRELGKLLGNDDYRVRLDAQFELVRRGDDGIKELAKAAKGADMEAARLHGIWGLGQILHQFRGQVTDIKSRKEPLEVLLDLLSDKNTSVRAQSAKMLADARAEESLAGLIKLAADPEPSVRFQAVMGLGKLNKLSALPAVLTMLRENDDKDPLLRHAGVMALTDFNDRATLDAAAKDSSLGVQMASLLAMRRLKYDDIEQFLRSSNPRLVREAVRAINDAPINASTLALARFEAKDWTDPVIDSRVVNANLRAGTLATADRLAGFGADADKPEAMREDALMALAEWGKPSDRDRVTGVWRPFIASSRDIVVPAAALKPHVATLLSNSPEGVQLAAIKAVTNLKISDAAGGLEQLVANKSASSKVRIAALNALAALDTPELATALEAASASGDDRLASAADSIHARSGKGNVLSKIEDTLKNGTIAAKQSAIQSLADIKTPEADKLLLSLMEQLNGGRLPVELGVDILDAGASRKKEPFTDLEKKIETGDGDPLAPYRFALKGGDPEAGKKIFREREDVACIRCHQAQGVGGEVGPHLDGVATRAKPEYILESIVKPNAKIAPGFESYMIETKDGNWIAGMIKKETKDELVINSPEDGFVTLKPSDVKSRERGASGMPEGMALILTRDNLRDLIAYLSTLK